MARTFLLRSALLIACALSISSFAFTVKAADPVLPNALPEATYRPLPTRPFATVKAEDEAQKTGVMARQQKLMESRYDLSDRPRGALMSGHRKAVQGGVRVKLPPGMTWESLSRMTPEEIKQRDLLPQGFRPLPHVKQTTGGQVFPPQQIEHMQRLEHRDLRRFDVDFDLPEHLTPEFPPPLFLTTHPERGDVSRGQLLSLANFYDLMLGLLTPVQMDGLRLLLTPFPQEEFNFTEDRKVAAPSRGVACLDCHANFHTNAAFHLTPDIRPQAERFRLDTTSLRGVFNQQIHGSKRSLRSLEDFTEFEQRTAYFNGDHVSAARKGINPLDRATQVVLMAQMQNIVDFPPAPKLDPSGRLNPAQASPQELMGEKIFLGKGRCAQCHAPESAHMNQQMHDLHLERFYATGRNVSDLVQIPDGPIKTFTLRGIKDSPPYLHDGRLLTLADTVEFFNLVLGLKLSTDEKAALEAYLLAL